MDPPNELVDVVREAAGREQEQPREGADSDHGGERRTVAGRPRHPDAGQVGLCIVSLGTN
jgi:hypothetical protein